MRRAALCQEQVGPGAVRERRVRRVLDGEKQHVVDGEASPVLGREAESQTTLLRDLADRRDVRLVHEDV